jgi:hypothetical protein
MSASTITVDAQREATAAAIGAVNIAAGEVAHMRWQRDPAEY